jgi:hypothetical protein
MDAAVATAYDPLLDNEPELARTMAASVTQRIAFGERAGGKVRGIGPGFGYEGKRPALTGPCCASVHGFSLHANTEIPAHRRDQVDAEEAKTATPYWHRARPLGRVVHWIWPRVPFAAGARSGSLPLSLRSRWSRASCVISSSRPSHLRLYLPVVAKHSSRLTRPRPVAWSRRRHARRGGKRPLGAGAAGPDLPSDGGGHCKAQRWRGCGSKSPS